MNIALVSKLARWMATAVVFALASLLFSQEAPVTSPTVVTQSAFTVVGIAVRTSNTQEMSPNGAIPKQWQRLFAEGLLDKIPDKAAMSVIAVYTDYQSERNGPYTYVLGARVKAAKNVPAGMVAKAIPAGKYSRITTERGPVGKVVSEAWQRIWSLTPTQLGGERAYKADYEIYEERAADPQNAQVDIYVGLK